MSSTLLNSFGTKNSTSYKPTNLDRILHYGHPIVLDVQLWTLISNFFVIALVYAYTRLYRAGSALSFSILRSDNYDWDVDQLRALYRNVGLPRDALVNLRTLQPWLYERSRRDDTRTILSIILWKLFAAAALILTALSPFLMSLVPIVPGKLGNGGECTGFATPHYYNISSQSVVFQMYSRRASVGLSNADANYRLTVKHVNDGSVGLNDGESYMIKSSCPSYADPKVCDPENPFSLDATFWLTPGEARVGGINKENIRVGYKNTCYKARLLSEVLSTDDTGNFTLGLLFGPQNGHDYTVKATSYSAITDSYKWDSFPNSTLPNFYKILPDYLKTEATQAMERAWRPNDTLNHHGDVTVMFFQTGATLSLKSDDPLFETKSTSEGGPDEGLYKPKELVVPMICNTSFKVCHTGTCEDVGAAGGFWNWTQDHYRGPSVAKGYLETLALDNVYPLLGVIPFVPSSIKALQTVYEGVQSCDSCTSAGTEMLRLLLAARSWMASAPSRVARGNSSADLLDLTTPPKVQRVNDGQLGLFFYTSPDQANMCSSVLLDDTGKLVISANLLAGLAAVIIGVLLALVLGAFLHKQLWVFGGAFDLRWRSYGFLQIHRMLAEETTGVRWKGAIDSFPEGPDINHQTGAGRVSALRVVKVSGGGGDAYAHVNTDDVEDQGKDSKLPIPPQHQQANSDAPGYYTVVRHPTGLGEDLNNKNLPKRRQFLHR